MSEESEQSPPEEQETLPPISHARILWLMGAVTAAGTVAGFLFASASFAVGVLVGGALSLLNYHWLRRSIRSLFENPVEGEKPPFLATRYFLRYLTFAAILAFIYMTRSVPVVAVLLGLASFAVAIRLEGFSRLFSSFYKKGN